tara:strand:- start:410 stop:619 length:210 start_codon:yes stop_codon:yes gene_type:complete
MSRRKKMEVGDLVLFRESHDIRFHIDRLGIGIILSRSWNDEIGFWENIVWFEKLQQHCLCDDIDLKKVA